MDLGGLLIVPACILLLRLAPMLAQGTALFGLILVSLPGLLIYTRTGDLDLSSVVWMSFGAVFGGLVGAYVLFTYITPALAVSLFGATLALIAVGRFLGANAPRDTDPQQ